MHPKTILIQDYTYHLPTDKIAAHPLEIRDESRLLVYRDGVIHETVYKRIADWLPGDSLIVFNDTRVIEARLLFQKSTGGLIEVFCLEPHERYPDIATAMLQEGSVWWKCMIGGASKWKHGAELEKAVIHEGETITLTASIKERREDSFIVEFSWSPSQLSFAALLHLAGVIPLPPYIKRAASSEDAERYQTVYAAANGSVAAPTAGLHFTDEIFSALAEKNIRSAFVTLHVGAGTFKPVKTAAIADHQMHAEFIQVTAANIRLLMEYSDKKIIAVGTTSLRTIESLYWLGVKISQDPLIEPSDCFLLQWEAYDLKLVDLTVTDALNSLLQWLTKNNLHMLTARTELLVAPGYQLKLADILVTNFHQPQSTLLLLVAAVAGPQWKDIYDHALANDYRFLSYGDGCLLFADAKK